jgi:hypothetical protein
LRARKACGLDTDAILIQNAGVTRCSRVIAEILLWPQIRDTDVLIAQDRLGRAQYNRQQKAEQAASGRARIDRAVQELIAAVDAL